VDDRNVGYNLEHIERGKNYHMILIYRQRQTTYTI
jgi:hypothetical protein